MTTSSDDRLAVEKFSQSRIWDKVTEGSTLIFGVTRISLKHSIMIGREKPPYKNQINPFNRFDTTPACDRETDGHSTTANTALA